MPNGDMSPTYYFRAMVKGRVIQRSTGCVDERKAKAFARKTVDKLRRAASAEEVVLAFRDVLAGGEAIALDQCWKKYEKKPTRKKVKEEHLKAKESCWQDFLAYLNAVRPTPKTLNDVTSKMAEGYIEHLQAEGKFNKTVEFKRKGKKRRVSYQSEITSLSPRTCNFYLTTLKSVFEVLSADAGILENPFEKIPPLPLKQADREAFSPRELELIGKKADPFIYGIFVVGMYTGLREADICTLKWLEVDLKTGWIEREMRKTSKIVRIPILPPLRVYLETLPKTSEYVLPKHAEMYENNRHGISWRVRKFLDELKDDNDKDFSITTRKQVDGRKRKVSVKDVHSLRHTFCWVAAAHGVPLPIVQSIVGHVDEKMTRHYAAHATDEQTRRHLEKMPALLGQPDFIPNPSPGIIPEKSTMTLLESALEEHDLATVKEKIREAMQFLAEDTPNDSR